MTIRRSLIRSAEKAMTVLGDSCSLVERFILSKQNEDGGFFGRAKHSDLYYTVFGIETLLATGAKLPKEAVSDFLTRINHSELDLVHLACWIRCFTDLQIDFDLDLIAKELEKFRSSDFGFDNCSGSACGSIYSAFMSLGAYQDLGIDLPNSSGLIEFVMSRRLNDGSYSNDNNIPIGSVPATAAAILLSYYLSSPVCSKTVDWLLSGMHPNGGFTATPQVPIPDLLSTAVALCALSFTDAVLDPVQKEKCLDFVDSLWSGNGGFCGSLADRAVDCEYTFYGLMAIGYLT